MCLEKKKFFVELSKNCILGNCPSAQVLVVVAVQLLELLEYLCAHAVQNEKANMRSTKKLGDTCWEIFQKLGDAISQHDT